MMMDEPFAVHDAITGETMNDQLSRLWDHLGQMVMLVSHNINEAIKLFARVPVLNKPPYGIYRVLKNEPPGPRSGPEMRTSELFWQYKKALIAGTADVTKGVIVSGSSRVNSNESEKEIKQPEPD